LINTFFRKENCNLVIKKFNTYCLIENKIISDPTEDEVSISDFYVSNIIYNSDDSKIKYINLIVVLIYKIKGESINSDLLFESFNFE